MKKLIIAVILTTALLAGLGSVCFAENELDIIYDTALSEDGSTLDLTVTAVGAAGLQSGDLSVAYDESKYEYVSHKIHATEDLMIVAGKAVTEDGLLTCSFITSGDAITAEMCNGNGDLPLVTYTLKVLDGSDAAVAVADPDAPVENAPDDAAQADPAATAAAAANADPADDFFMYVVSADVNGKSVQVPAKGQAELAAEHYTGGVTVPANDGKYVIEDAKNPLGAMSWYVIALIFVVVIAGAVGIAFAVRKKDSANTADEKAAEPADSGSAPDDENDEKR